MSASITNDKIRAVRNGGTPVPTTVSSERSIDGTSLSCVALTDWPTDTAVDFITYRKKSDGTINKDTLCVWRGIVSGTTIGSLTLADGTDAGNDVGDYVESAVTSEWGQGLYDWGTTEHNTDGTHDNTKVAMLAGTQTFTGDKTFTGAVTLPDSSVTTDNLGDGGWQTLTAISPFTAQNSLAVRKIGNVVHIRGAISRSSGSSTTFIDAIQLPTGYGMTENQILAVHPTNDTAFWQAEYVESTNRIQLSQQGASSAWCPFAGLSWLTD